MSLEYLPLDRIRPDPDQVRQSKTSKEDDAILLASVKTLGVLDPVHVRAIEGGDDFMLVNGHRRYAAAKKAKLATVPAMIVKPGSNLTLIQTASNVARADMSMVDVWLAVEKMTADGLTVPAIALALAKPERAINHMRLLSHLHPSIVAYIRSHPEDAPSEADARTICQASQDRQAEVFKSCRATWWNMSRELALTGVPLAAIRFPVEHYTGDKRRDLFDDDAATLLTDIPQVIRLQEEWCEAQRAAAIKAGFLAGICATETWGGTKPPPGCEGWSSPVPAKTPKADRAQWVKTYTVLSDGSVHEAAYRVKQRAVASTASKVAASPVTKKGIETIEQAQRDGLAASLRAASAPEGYTPDLLAVALVLLRERLPHSVDGDLDDLFTADGRLNVVDEDRRAAIHRLAGILLPSAVAMTGFSTALSLAMVQRLGAAFNSDPVWWATRDDLDMLKGPAFAHIEVNCPLGDGTQKVKRDRLFTKCEPDAAGYVALRANLVPDLAYRPAPLHQQDAQEEEPMEGDRYGEPDEDAEAA